MLPLKTEKKARFLGLMTLALLLLASAHVNAQTLKQQQQREASEKQVEIRLREVREKLRDLSIDSSALTDQARTELKRLSDELKTGQEAAGRKLKAMRASDSRDWERSRAEANAAVDALNGVYDRMQSLKYQTRR